MYKRGYSNGEQSLEIYDGKVDLVLYNENEKSPSFYFYRFPSESVFGERLPRSVSIVDRKGVVEFLKAKGMEYESLIKRLLKQAWETGMTARDEM